MKKYIQNLFMPFAVLAMLTVGAFTINASEKTDKAVNVETEIETESKAENPYSGDIFIRVLEPGTSNYLYSKVGEIEKGECTLDVTDQRCTTIVEGMNHDLWGENEFGGYSELYQEENL